MVYVVVLEESLVFLLAVVVASAAAAAAASSLALCSSCFTLTPVIVLKAPFGETLRRLPESLLSARPQSLVAPRSLPPSSTDPGSPASFQCLYLVSLRPLRESYGIPWYPPVSARRSAGQPSFFVACQKGE